MKFEVIITPSAKADIFETNTWLLENHPDVANVLNNIAATYSRDKKVSGISVGTLLTTLMLMIVFEAD